MTPQPTGAPAPPPARSPIPPWAWLFVVTGLVGAVGGILPWFRPSAGPLHADSPVHSWNDGRLVIAGPLIMLGCGIWWLLALLGKRPAGRYGEARHGVIVSTIGGALTVVSLPVAWALVPHNYRDWKIIELEAHLHGLSLSRGPQLGFWLVGVCGLAYLALGVVGLIQFRQAAPPAPTWGRPSPGQIPAWSSSGAAPYGAAAPQWPGSPVPASPQGGSPAFSAPPPPAVPPTYAAPSWIAPGALPPSDW